MTRNPMLVVTAVGALIMGGGVLLVGLRAGEPVTGAALERASAAALQYTGGGQVTDTEIDDEEGYYEVEVTLADGTQMDVHLDSSFNVISSEADDEDGPEDGEDPDDD